MEAVTVLWLQLHADGKHATLRKEDGTLLFTVPNTDVDIAYALDASKTIYPFDEIEVIAGGKVIRCWAKT